METYILRKPADKLTKFRKDLPQILWWLFEFTLSFSEIGQKFWRMNLKLDKSRMHWLEISFDVSKNTSKLVLKESHVFSFKNRFWYSVERATRRSSKSPPLEDPNGDRCTGCIGCIGAGDVHQRRVRQIGGERRLAHGAGGSVRPHPREPPGKLTARWCISRSVKNAPRHLKTPTPSHRCGCEGILFRLRTSISNRTEIPVWE